MLQKTTYMVKWGGWMGGWVVVLVVRVCGREGVGWGGVGGMFTACKCFNKQSERGDVGWV